MRFSKSLRGHLTSLLTFQMSSGQCSPGGVLNCSHALAEWPVASCDVKFFDNRVTTDIFPHELLIAS